VLSKLDGVVEQGPRELLQELTREELHELSRLLKKARCCGGGAQNGLPLTGKPPSPRSTLPPPRPE
jgi:hypothetical protein